MIEEGADKDKETEHDYRRDSGSDEDDLCVGCGGHEGFAWPVVVRVDDDAPKVHVGNVVEVAHNDVVCALVDGFGGPNSWWQLCSRRTGELVSGGVCIDDDRGDIVDGDVVFASCRSAKVEHGKTVSAEIKVDGIACRRRRVIVVDGLSVDIGWYADIVPMGSGPKGGLWISVIDNASRP